jgi:hypothetical protein
MSVSFEALVQHPDDIVPRLAQFLDITDKIPAMRACIDPALYRVRKTDRAPRKMIHSTATERL